MQDARNRGLLDLLPCGRFGRHFMSDDLLRAAAMGFGVALWAGLLGYLERKQAASRREHGRGLIEQACYRLGRLWARRHSTTH